MSESVQLVLAIALVGAILGFAYWNSTRSSSKLPTISHWRNLKHGNYEVLLCEKLSGEDLGGTSHDDSYLVVLKCPKGRIREYRFTSKPPDGFAMKEGRVEDFDPVYN